MIKNEKDYELWDGKDWGKINDFYGESMYNENFDCPTINVYAKHNVSKRDVIDAAAAIAVAAYDKGNFTHVRVYVHTPKHGTIMAFCHKNDKKHVFAVVDKWSVPEKFDFYPIMKKIACKYKFVLDRSYLPFVREKVTEIFKVEEKSE